MLVTGATGNVGAPLVAALSGLGVDVRAAARRPTSSPEPRVQPVAFDFTEASTYDRAFSGVSAMFLVRLTRVHAQAVRERDELLMPAGRGRTAFVDAEDVAAVAAKALVDPQPHANAACTLTGSEALTYGEVAGIMTAVLGRPIRYRRPGLLSYALRAPRELGLPPAMVAATSAVYTTARLGLACGLSPDVHRILVRPPTTMAAFVERERASFGPVQRPLRQPRTANCSR